MYITACSLSGWDLCLNVFIMIFLFREQLAHTLVSVCVHFWQRALFGEHASKKLRHVFTRTGATLELFTKNQHFQSWSRFIAASCEGFSHLL